MKKWLGGIIQSVAGGCVTGAGLVVIDPAKFNFQQGIVNLLIVVAFVSAIQVLTFLKQSPLPNWNGQALPGPSGPVAK